MESSFDKYVAHVDALETQVASQPCMMGFPMNHHRVSELAPLFTIMSRHMITNNCGDPFDAHVRPWRAQTLDTEAQLLRTLMKPWGANSENAWGYLTTGK